MEKEKIGIQSKQKNDKELGVDLDEQKMNGSYGMVETPEEDNQHKQE